MSIEDRAETLMDEVADLKKNWVEINPDQPDILATIQVYRGGELVAQAANVSDPRKMVELANVMAYGCSADELVLCAEIYASELKENPMTQLPWDPGEVGFMAREYPESVKKGWVCEAIAVMGYDREGNHFFGTLAFHVDGKDVVWGKRHLFKFGDKEAASFDSTVHDMLLNEVMARETIIDKMKSDLGEQGYNFVCSQFTEVVRMGQADISTVKHVLSNGFAITAGLVAKPDTERHEYIERKMQEVVESLGTEMYNQSSGGAPVMPN